MVSVFCPHAETRTIRHPEATSFLLLFRHLQAFLTPQPLNAFVIHMPSFPLQQPGDSPVTVTTVAAGQLDNPRHESWLITRGIDDMALGRTRLGQNTASSPL